MTLYNLLGQQVKTLVTAIEDAGARLVTWDGTDRAGRTVPSGVYFVRVEMVPDERGGAPLVGVRKMLLLR